MAKIIINCGIVPVQVDDQEDGVITFGKHAGERLSSEEVPWRYLAWTYAYLESHGLPDWLMPVLELVWYWGNLKWEAEVAGASVTNEKDFDEYVDEARIGIDEGFQAEQDLHRERGWQLTYDYDPERDVWDTVTVDEKRRRERARIEAQAVE